MTLALRRDLRRRILSNQRVLGVLSFLPSAGLIEILGHAGLDFAVIDLEHSPKSWECVEHLVRACELTGMAPLVRVARIDDKEILQALEVGAQGIVVPFVETADDVRRASAAMRYPPHGVRGTCTQTRAAGYSRNRADFVRYSSEREQGQTLVGLIESRKAIDNIDQILAVENGLDVVFIGRADLASDLGLPGQSGHPVVQEATERVIDAAHRAGKKIMLAQYAPQECEEWARRGVSVFCFPSESGVIYDCFSTYRRDIDARWAKLESS